MNKPHRAVPQNFQMRGGRGIWMAGMGAAALAGLSRELIARLTFS
jgi:hypothetical protein